ncbi:MAG: hypothetical protein ACO3CH_00430 [Ilumatobacteraceae bacterium]
MSVDRSKQLEAVKAQFSPEFPPTISCDEGWHTLVIDCHLELWAIDPNYSILQIKEKFGTLRYYFSPSEPMAHLRKEMNKVVAVYESVSSYKCEKCGDMGATLRNRNRWMKTLCDSCNGD